MYIEHYFTKPFLRMRSLIRLAKPITIFIILLINTLEKKYPKKIMDLKIENEAEHLIIVLNTNFVASKAKYASSLIILIISKVIFEAKITLTIITKSFILNFIFLKH